MVKGNKLTDPLHGILEDLPAPVPSEACPKAIFSLAALTGDGLSGDAFSAPLGRLCHIDPAGLSRWALALALVLALALGGREVEERHESMTAREEEGTF